MDPLKILSSIYDLLASSSSKDLESAANAAGNNSDISEALWMLAKYRRRHNIGTSTTKSSKRKRAEPPLITGKSVKQSNATLYNGMTTQLEKVVYSDYFHSNEELAAYLDSVGMPVKFNRKDGRSRMVQKIVTNIKKLPYSEQKKILSNIFSVLPKSETSSWFEAIRRK